MRDAGNISTCPGSSAIFSLNLNIDHKEVSTNSTKHHYNIRVSIETKLVYSWVLTPCITEKYWLLSYSLYLASLQRIKEAFNIRYTRHIIKA